MTPVVPLDSCLQRLSTRSPALPFCRSICHTIWRSQVYPSVLNHLGDHLQRRRLDLGLTVREVAERLGVEATSVANWLKGRSKPAIRHMPKVLAFLGYDPRPNLDGIAGRLRLRRETLGLSRGAAAERMQVDRGTLQRWAQGEKEPTGRFLVRVSTFLDQ